ncbi:MAG: hypothetical protein ABSF95_11250 [Verrucomicrobiota bacterium]|jgi:hypothetical protein
MKSKTQSSSYPIGHVFITWLALNNLVTQQATAAEVQSVKDVPKIEQKLVESIATEGAKDRFLIQQIRPAGTGTIKGTICIAGKGSLPLSKDTAERLGEGVILEWIHPVQRGAEVNAEKGKSGMLLRNQQLDYSPTYSVGALWERIPNLVDKDRIDPLNGVAFVPGVRLGGLYDGDGNLMFDYLKAGEQIVHFPAGTTGSIIRFVGEITVGKYVFIGENDVLYPLTFLLTSDGFVYLRGKGKVALPTGKMVDPGKTTESSTATLSRLSNQQAIAGSGTRSGTGQHSATSDLAGAKPSDNPSRDIEIIQDATRIKLIGLAMAPRTPGIASADLQPNGSIIMRPPSWAGKFDDILSKTRDALFSKYELDPQTCKIHSAGRLDHIGTRQEGNDTLVYMDMDEWSDIITVTPPSTKLLPVKLKSGLMTLRLPAMDVAFEEGAVCSVNGNRYVHRNGRWTVGE